MDKDTNRPFTNNRNWRDMVAELHEEFFGVAPTGIEIHDWSEFIYGVQKKIPMRKQVPSRPHTGHPHITHFRS
eukprot:4572785-Prymnesium_polylepis.1